MRKKNIFIIICLLTTSIKYTHAQTPGRTESEENFENAKIIVTGTIKIIDRIAYKIKAKKSEKKLEQWRAEGRLGVDCWYINSKGDLEEDLNYDCWIGDYHYGKTSCSSCIELQHREAVRLQKEEYECNIREQQKTVFELETEKQFVDLGLPSGTLWKRQNEDNLFEYQEAISQYGNQIPTQQQWEELMSLCQWTITRNGYRVVGSNGQSIDLPKDGFTMCDQAERISVGSLGIYTSSTLSDESGFVWSLMISGNDKFGEATSDCWRKAVRLVK